MRLDVRRDWLAHVDEIPRALVAANAVATLDALEPSPRHHHRKAQLLFTVRGAVNCEVDGAVWIVPPQCAVWIPGGLPHSVFGSGEVERLSLHRLSRIRDPAERLLHDHGVTLFP